MIPPKTLTKQGFELQFGVNHLGTIAFTGLVHPHVDDRIVITGSIAHRNGAMDYSDLSASRSYHNWARYQMSKLANRSEEHTSELQSLMRISYAVFCLKKKKNH